MVKIPEVKIPEEKIPDLKYFKWINWELFIMYQIIFPNTVELSFYTNVIWDMSAVIGSATIFNKNADQLNQISVFRSTLFLLAT